MPINNSSWSSRSISAADFTTPASGAAPPLSNGQRFCRTPLLPPPGVHPSSHYLSLQAISVNGTLLPIPASAFRMQDPTSGKGGVLLDSSSAITRLSPPLYLLLRDAFRAAIATTAPAFRPSQPLNDFDTCFDYQLPSQDHVNLTANNIIPTVAFHFEGDRADLYLPPANTFVPAVFFTHQPSRKFCLAFAPSTASSSSTAVIDAPKASAAGAATAEASVVIGGVQQRGFLFSFDTHNSLLNFAPFQC